MGKFTSETAKIANKKSLESKRAKKVVHKYKHSICGRVSDIVEEKDCIFCQKDRSNKFRKELENSPSSIYSKENSPSSSKRVKAPFDKSFDEAFDEAIKKVKEIPINQCGLEINIISTKIKKDSQMGLWIVSICSSIMIGILLGILLII